MRQVDQQEIGQRATSGLPSFTPRPTSTQYPEPGTSAQYQATIQVTTGHTNAEIGSAARSLAKILHECPTLST